MIGFLILPHNEMLVGRADEMLAERAKCWQRGQNVGREGKMLEERAKCWQRGQNVGREGKMLSERGGYF